MILPFPDQRRSCWEVVFAYLCEDRMFPKLLVHSVSSLSHFCLVSVSKGMPHSPDRRDISHTRTPSERETTPTLTVSLFSRVHCVYCFPRKLSFFWCFRCVWMLAYGGARSWEFLLFVLFLCFCGRLFCLFCGFVLFFLTLFAVKHDTVSVYPNIPHSVWNIVKRLRDWQIAFLLALSVW